MAERQWEGKVREVLLRIAQVKSPHLTAVAPQDDLLQDLAFDSLDFAQLAVELDDALGVAVFESYPLKGLATVAEVCEACEALLAAQAQRS